MAATVSSPWATKPGAWALDAEEHEEELQQQRKVDSAPKSDFPTLSAAAATKGKKKKAQTLSLSEFAMYTAPRQQPVSQSVGLTPDEQMNLPTGPRERSAEEMETSRGFRGFGSGPGNREGRWGSDRGNDEGRRGRDSSREPLGPSRADEADNWGAGKKTMSFSNGGFERGERRSTGAFFGSDSKADESDSWVSRKSFVPAAADPPRRGFGSGGFENEGRSRRSYEPFTQNGAAGADGDSWSRKREERVGNMNSNVNGVSGENGAGGRPRLNLKPRTLPVTFERPQSPDVAPMINVVAPVEVVPRAKGANPFGNARPREEVLAEKGKDWKEIDEKLESRKIKEIEAVVEKGDGPVKKGFGTGGWRGAPAEEKTGRSWRKPEAPAAIEDARPASADKSAEKPEENGNHHPEVEEN